MPNIRLLRLSVLLTTLAAAMAFDIERSWAGGDDPIVIVVSTKSPLTNISKSQLRTLYLQNRISIGGKQFKPLNLKASNATRREFDKKMLRMTSSETARYWADRKVKGRGLGPKEVSNSLKVQVTAYKTSSAIGYVRLSELKAGKLKVLTIEGKSPGAPAYPLN